MKKILVLTICPYLFSSKTYIDFWKNSSADKVIPNIRPKSSIGLISSVDFILSVGLRGIALELSYNHDFIELFG